MDSPNGFDIGPGEERRMMVNVISGLDTEGEPIYRQHYLNRPANSRFYEPVDLSSEVDALRSDSRKNNRSEHQKYHSERERLKTFDGVWKPEYNVQKEDLARDGFIYRGPGDLVMCVFCLKSIRKWDAGDSVSGEHQRLYPRCPWVLEKVHHMNIPISTADSLKKSMKVIAKGQPHFTDMKTTDARFETFNGWIKRNTITVGALVKAGFFYDSDNDVVTCFHCGTKIPGWDLENDFLGHHARNSPDCPMAHPESPGHNTHSGASFDVELAGHPVDENESNTSESQHQATVNIDEDMQSPAVQAIMFSYGEDYNLDEIRKAVQSLRISKGSGHISSKEILQKLDPDLDD